MTTVAAGWARFPRPTSATSSRSSDPKAKAWWVRRPYRWMDGAAFLCGYGAGARFSAGARLDQRRTAPARRRSAGTARNHRLLDVLLNQLHAHLSAVAEDRAQVWRPGGRGRCPTPPSSRPNARRRTSGRRSCATASSTRSSTTATLRCGTRLGGGAAGRADGPGTSAAFREPGGVYAGTSGLYIADTNNHRIAVADWATGTVRTLIGD